MPTSAKARPHYAWAIFLACCLLQCGVLGLIQNCRGLFYTPVCNDLGFSMASFTFYTTLHGIFAALMLPLAGRLLTHEKMHLLLAGAGAVFALSTAAMGTFHTLGAWYVAGALQGAAGGVLIYLPTPMLISNWFAQKAGTMVGVAGALSGVAGVVMNPLGSAIIAQLGWRIGYFVFGGLCFLFTVPAMLFLVRLTPQSMGLASYGAAAQSGEKAAVQSAAASPRAFSARPFFCVLVMAAMFGYLCGYSQFFPSYAALRGLPVTVGGAMVSLSMLGNIVGKTSIGVLDDRFGSLRTTLLTIGVISLAHFALLFSSLRPVLFGALFSGVSMAACTVAQPLMARALFPPQLYSRLYSYVTMATALSLAFSQVAIGALRDAFGGFEQALVIGLLVSLLSAGVAWLAFLPTRAARDDIPQA